MILLDTCVLIWWTTSHSPTGAAQRSALRVAEASSSDGFAASAISVLEIARKLDRQELDFSGNVQDWFDAVSRLPTLRFIDVTSAIAISSVSLLRDYPNRDPADRLIVATSNELSLPIHTTDQKMIDYAGVQTVPLGMS